MLKRSSSPLHLNLSQESIGWDRLSQRRSAGPPTCQAHALLALRDTGTVPLRDLPKIFILQGTFEKQKRTVFNHVTFLKRVARNTHFAVCAYLNPKRASEAPDAIVRGRTVVIHEDMVVATISKDGTTEFSNFRRCF